MRIRVRLIYLLIFIVIMSLGLFIVQRVLERHKLLELWGSVRAEREAMFEKILALHTRPLKGFVSDYTFWDDMVEFAARPSKKWAEENIEASMGTFSADAAWVYNQEQKLIYAYFDSEKYPWLKDNLFAPEVLEQIFSRSPIAHFFINISGNLIEVWGATIHPTADVQRQTPGQGYFFCGRVWTPEYLNELALLISSQVILTEGPQKLSKGTDKQGLINFPRELPGWDGQAVKYLLVSAASPAIIGTQRLTGQVVVLFLVFSAAIVLIVPVFIFRWVNLPLKSITAALENEDPACLQRISKQTTEFGQVARMIESFFSQKQIILKEVAQRKQTQDALNKVNNCFISFGLDSDRNIQLITQTAGEILNATCVFYNYYQGGMLQTRASWHEPPDFSHSSPAQGHICYDVIASQKSQLIFIDDLQRTSYAQTDPNVLKYNLQSYLSCPIRVQGRTVSSLCAVFASHDKPDPYQLNLLNVLGQAVSIEEERKHMEEIFKSQAVKLDEALKDALRSREVLLSMLEDNQLNKAKLEASVTELAVAYAKLKESQEEVIRSAKFGAIGQLASSVAHEVRNPLAIIMQSIDYLQDKIPAQHREVVQLAANNVRRANTIVATLLDFAKVKELKIQAEDVNAIVEDSLKLVRYSNLQGKVQILRELAQNLPPVLVDRQKIEQVFVNLILNAMQAMPEGGQLLIRTYAQAWVNLAPEIKQGFLSQAEETKDMLVIEIQDTGVGISEENLKNIFRPFFTTKGAMTGIGLGLSVVKDIINLHGGYVGLESQVNQGTKVTVILKGI